MLCEAVQNQFSGKNLGNFRFSFFFLRECVGAEGILGGVVLVVVVAFFVFVNAEVVLERVHPQVVLNNNQCFQMLLTFFR